MGLVAKTPRPQCREPGFNPWSGNQIWHTTTKTCCSQINKYHLLVHVSDFLNCILIQTCKSQTLTSNCLLLHLHSDISKSTESILNSLPPLKRSTTCGLPHLIVKVSPPLPVAQAEKFGAGPDSSLLLSHPALIHQQLLLALPSKRFNSWVGKVRWR